MLPDDVLSTLTIPSAFLPPRDRRKDPLVAYEMGGTGLNDADAGLRVKIWRGRVTGAGAVVLDAPGVAATTIITVPGITEMQFSFDQNMQPFVTYMTAAGAFFYWFDATVTDFVTTQLPAKSRSPRCSLDDKRATQGAASDIVLAYLRGTHLYVRSQGDRYDTEYDLYTDANMALYQLDQVGMARALRFQFALRGRTIG